MNTLRPRVLVFVVAYEAESTLRKVLDRIPRPMFERFDAEVLVIDDSSSDRTFEVGLRSLERALTRSRSSTTRPIRATAAIRSSATYAIRNGFDFVVLLHGDGQYAPGVHSRLARRSSTATPTPCLARA